jgi:hypothetical protein
MKSRILLFFGLVFVYSLLNGYPVRESLFKHFTDDKAPDTAAYLVEYENRDDGTPSGVVIVNGVTAFNEVVLKGSVLKPVVVKIHSVKSTDSTRSLPLFQEIAGECAEKAVCVAMDLFATHKEQPENYQVILHIMAKFGINRLQLPTYLFYKNGKLEPTQPVAYGFQTKEQLVSLLKRYTA